MWLSIPVWCSWKFFPCAPSWSKWTHFNSSLVRLEAWETDFINHWNWCYFNSSLNCGGRPLIEQYIKQFAPISDSVWIAVGRLKTGNLCFLSIYFNSVGAIWKDKCIICPSKVNPSFSIPVWCSWKLDIFVVCVASLFQFQFEYGLEAKEIQDLPVECRFQFQPNCGWKNLFFCGDVSTNLLLFQFSLVRLEDRWILLKHHEQKNFQFSLQLEVYNRFFISQLLFPISVWQICGWKLWMKF